MYKISRDSKIQFEQKEIELKNNIFISNPDLYSTLFDDNQTEEDFEIEAVVPETEDDVNKLLAELKREGVIK
jgi:hypothetical protein